MLRRLSAIRFSERCISNDHRHKFGCMSSNRLRCFIRSYLARNCLIITVCSPFGRIIPSIVHNRIIACRTVIVSCSTFGKVFIPIPIIILNHRKADKRCSRIQRRLFIGANYYIGQNHVAAVIAINSYIYLNILSAFDVRFNSHSIGALCDFRRCTNKLTVGIDLYPSVIPFICSGFRIRGYGE